VDDLAISDVGFMGSKISMKRPIWIALAAKGMIFYKWAMQPSAVCSPSRASIWTGKFVAKVTASPTGIRRPGSRRLEDHISVFSKTIYPQIMHMHCHRIYYNSRSIKAEAFIKLFFAGKSAFGRRRK